MDQLIKQAQADYNYNLEMEVYHRKLKEEALKVLMGALDEVAA